MYSMARLKSARGESLGGKKERTNWAKTTGEEETWEENVMKREGAANCPKSHMCAPLFPMGKRQVAGQEGGEEKKKTTIARQT